MARVRFQTINQTRLLLMAALFGAFTVAMTAVALSYSPSAAQSRAERQCMDEGVRPYTPTWELCVAHVTRAFEWDDRSLAQQLARASSDATQTCLDHGLAPQSAGFRACLGRELDAHSQLQILGSDDSGRNVAEHPGIHLIGQQQ